MPDADATAALYAAFEHYPRRDVIEGCPCCVSPDDGKRLHRVPLRRLTEEDLGRYAAKALTTWGDDDDYRHFLPRLLELSTQHPSHHGLELAHIAGTLQHARFATWPESERGAVLAWLRRWWGEIVEGTAERAYEVVEAFALIGDVDELLADWAGRSSLAAVLHIAEAITQAWARGMRLNAVLVQWLRAPARVALMQARFDEGIDEDSAEVLAYAIDLWELVNKT